jgi:hypothetical protein
MRVSNTKCRPLVQSNVEFQANNIFAENKNGNYVVFSYGHHWPLFAFINGLWYENSDKYTVTTSKHRNNVHPHVDTIKVSVDELRRMI